MKVGDIVICVSEGECNDLTVGKQYVVKGIGNDFDEDAIIVTDDAGNTIGFYSERFELCK